MNENELTDETTDLQQARDIARAYTRRVGANPMQLLAMTPLELEQAADSYVDILRLVVRHELHAFGRIAFGRGVWDKTCQALAEAEAK